MAESIQAGIDAVGKFITMPCMPGNPQQLLISDLNKLGERVQIFDRLIMNGVMFYSPKYSRAKLFDPTYVSYLKNNRLSLIHI